MTISILKIEFPVVAYRAVVKRHLSFALVGTVLLALPRPIWADCDIHSPSEGDTVTCDTTKPNPDTIAIGSNANDVTVNVLNGAQLDTSGSTGDTVAIRGRGDNWMVNNSGTIRGTRGVVIHLDGVISNSGLIDGMTVEGSPGLGVNLNKATLTNFSGGVVTGPQIGVSIFTGGAVNNQADAVISSGVGPAVLIDNPGTGVITNSGMIEGGTTGIAIINDANGTITNSGTITAATGAAIGGPITGDLTLTLRTGSIINGDVLGGDSGTDTLNLEGTNSEESNFSGFESVNVTDGANWTLSGDLLASMVDIVGSLRINGLLQGSILVQSSGRLEGTGTVGEITNNGTVAPGDSIGTLTVNGGYTHAAGATFEVEIEPSGDSDLLAISGGASLAGGTVSVLLAGGDYEPGTAFPILSADGGLTGEFAALEVDNPGVPLELVHEPENNRVLLVVSQQQEEGADLALSKTATVNEGATVVFTLEVTNNGPEDATEVVVTDPLPGCVSYVEDTCDGATGPPFTWTIGALASGTSLSCEVTVGTSECEGEQTNTATVSGAETDPNPDNDTAEATFDIEIVPALPTLALVLLAASLLITASQRLRRTSA